MAFSIFESLKKLGLENDQIGAISAITEAVYGVSLLESDGSFSDWGINADKDVAELSFTNPDYSKAHDGDNDDEVVEHNNDDEEADDDKEHSSSKCILCGELIYDGDNVVKVHKSDFKNSRNVPEGFVSGKCHSACREANAALFKENKVLQDVFSLPTIKAIDHAIYANTQVAADKAKKVVEDYVNSIVAKGGATNVDASYDAAIKSDASVKALEKFANYISNAILYRFGKSNTTDGYRYEYSFQPAIVGLDEYKIMQYSQYESNKELLKAALQSILDVAEEGLAQYSPSTHGCAYKTADKSIGRGNTVYDRPDIAKYVVTANNAGENGSEQVSKALDRLFMSDIDYRDAVKKIAALRDDIKSDKIFAKPSTNTYSAAAASGTSKDYSNSVIQKAKNRVIGNQRSKAAPKFQNSSALDDLFGDL